MQELFISETVSTQERREVQLTVGSGFYRQGGMTLARSLLKAEYGISDRLQLESELSFEHVRGSASEVDPGPQDLSAGLRYALLHPPRGFWLTGGLSLNSLNPESRALQLEPSLVAAIRAGQAQLQAGAAVTLTGLRENRYTFAMIYPLRRWRSTLELSEMRSGGEHATFLAPGLVRTVRGFEIGISTPVQMIGLGPRCTAMFLVTHEFNRESQ